MIISSSQYLSAFAHRKLPASFVRAMKRHAEENKIPAIATPLKLFECFCDVTRIKFGYTSLSRKRVLIKTVQGFVGALLSDSFTEGHPPTKANWAQKFIDTLSHLRKEVPGMPDITAIPANIDACKEQWRKLSENSYKNLDPSAVRYWSSWPIKASTGSPAYLKLSELWHSHGQKFTDDLYHAWKSFTGKSAVVSTTEINRFCKFLAANANTWPASTFADPIAIKHLFMSYMRDYFSRDNSRNSLSLVRGWNSFISNIEGVFIGPGLWARPFTSLPRIQIQATTGAKHKLKVNDHGVEVQNQLITEIPLHITDSEAIELLFHKVDYDISVVRCWALAESKSLFERARRRTELAKIGQPYIPGQPRPTKRGTLFQDHCATFEVNGFPKSPVEFKRQYGQDAKRTPMAHELGIPTAGTLFPYQCLLVSEHPKITTRFLIKLELYNPQGVTSGFLATDKGYQLIGFKDRRGASLSEMKVDLTDDSARWIKEVIEITQPLRDELRKKNDDRWRYLFLDCGEAFTNPGETTRPWSPSALKKHPKLRARLEHQFAPHIQLRDQALVDFISRVSLSRLRASCGVAVYLKTKDVKEMAKALGHAKYSAQLLAHYLPQSLLAFFQSRWVRIFQKGMIVLAMEKSPYILKATSFESMDELHRFLENHAIKEIPAHLVDPDGAEQRHPTAAAGSREIHIGVGAGSLTALLSLELAVKHATRPCEVSGKAKYWAEFASVITAEIERDNDGTLHEHLALAKQHCDPSRMEGLIYDAA